MSENSSSPNPYAAPRAEKFVPRTDEELRFDGVITQASYRRMLSVGPEQTLAWVLLLLLPLGGAVLMAASGYQIFVERAWLPSAGLIVLIAAWGGTLGGAIWLVQTDARARRYLKANPDLLGIARGALNRQGLIFDDGRIRHFFSWPALVKMKATPEGLRVPTDQGLIRFLALTADLFAGYSPRVAAAMLDRYARQGWTQEDVVQASARVYGQRADNERFFAGWVKYVLPWTLMGELQSLAWQLIGATVLIFASKTLVRWQPTPLVVAGLLALSAVVWYVLRYWCGGRQRKMYVWGWVDADRLVYGTGLTAMEIPYAHLEGIQLSDSRVIFRHSERLQLTIFADHFARPLIWHTLTHQLSHHFPQGATHLFSNALQKVPPTV